MDGIKPIRRSSPESQPRAAIKRSFQPAERQPVTSDRSYQSSANEPAESAESTEVLEIPAQAKSAGRFKWRFWEWDGWGKKDWVIFGAVTILVLGAGGFFAFNKFKKKPAPAPVVYQEPAPLPPEPPKPTTEASRLTGVQVAPELNQRPVIGIMIENSPDARPQSGLKDAGIVFEAIAEGGITRFLALFQEAQPQYIGPVRSVRPYYLDFLKPFDGSIVHAGGSPQGLSDIGALGIKDMNHNSAAFFRVSSRFAPHNLYTSMQGLDEYAKSIGHTSSTFTSLPRKDESPLATPMAKSIDLTISSNNYNVHYDYDAATNSYKRSLAGRAHNDEKAASQLTPKVVVALVMSHKYSGLYSVYQNTGSGKAVVFQDGFVVNGKWSKAGRSDQIVLTTEDGKPLTLNPGQTWFTLVANDGAVKSS